MEIQKFTNEYIDLVKDFDCGNLVINNFLKNGSALDENRGITYIMLADKNDFIIGYYNIEAGRVDQIESLDGKNYFMPMGASVNINYLAIHSKYQGIQIAEINDQKIYLGDLLLRDCEKRILTLRQQVGICFVTLCSTEEGYHLYHERNGYEDFEDDMNVIVQESDVIGYKLYKCVDDIVGISTVKK